MILRLKSLLGFALAADVFSYLTRMNEASTRAGERERGGGGGEGGLLFFFLFLVLLRYGVPDAV